MAAVICNDDLCVRPTDTGRAYLNVVRERQPFQRAKLYFLVGDELYQDPERLAHLIQITADELPTPKGKRKR